MIRSQNAKVHQTTEGDRPNAWNRKCIVLASVGFSPSQAQANVNEHMIPIPYNGSSLVFPPWHSHIRAKYFRM